MMPSQAQTLPLKAMHAGTAPSWWPPAPGWWLVAVIIAGLVAGIVYWWLRQRRQRQALERWFDAALVGLASPQEQVAQLSALLRRAARRVDPQADRLDGAEWLQFLDRGMTPPVFEQQFGLLLSEGIYQRNVDAAVADALRIAARRRFLSWMGAR